MIDIECDRQININRLKERHIYISEQEYIYRHKQMNRYIQAGK